MSSSNPNIEVKIPHSSGYDMSHRNSGSLTCGTITPLLVEEVIPGTRCNLRPRIAVQLPPLVSDTYMNLKLKVEAFCIPMRLLCRSFQDWFNNFPQRVVSYTSSAGGNNAARFENVKAKLPILRLPSDLASSYFGRGTLLDFLGFKIDSISADYVDINPLPLIAYHLVYQEYYRNPRVQNPSFVDDLGLRQDAVPPLRLASVPFKYFHGASDALADNSLLSFAGSIADNLTLADGSNIFNLRQRNFGLDFFTSSRVSAQQGDAAQVKINLPEGATESGFTIAQLRAANSLQMFRERNNLSAPRFVDQIYSRYGVRPSDGVAQRPILIGSASYDVITRGIDQTAPSVAAQTPQPSPFNSVGSQYGRAYGVGNDFIIDDFVVNEPSYIMVFQTLVPEATYSSGIAPYLRRYIADGSIAEMATPLLQNVGDEPIKSTQLVSDFGPDTEDTVFGYTDRFGTFMFHPSEAHSLLRDGGSLSSFVLQRSFNGNPELSSSFLEIPKNYLDPAFAVASAVSGLSAWYDSLLDWRISAPLAEFSIPSLQDPAYEHGNSIYIRRNGQIL